MADDKGKGGALSGGASSTASARRKHPTNDREIAEATGVTSIGERVRAEQGAKNVRHTTNPGNGLETIEGETVDQVRARVKREREGAEPSEFQKAMLGGPGPIQQTTAE